MSGRSRRRGREHGHLGCLRGRPGLRADRASHSSLRAVAAGSRGRVTEPQAGGCGGGAGHTRELEPHGGGAGPAEGHGRERGWRVSGSLGDSHAGRPAWHSEGCFLGSGDGPQPEKQPSASPGCWWRSEHETQDTERRRGRGRGPTTGRWGPGERGARHGDGARLSQAGGILITPSNGWTPSADPSGHAVVQCPRALCPRRTLRLWPHARPAGPGHRGQRRREAWGADSAGSLVGSPWLAGPSGGDRCPAPCPSPPPA